MATIVSPSLLAADFGNLERECRMIDESAADWLHIDIMDGVFVPNISMGMPVVKAVRRCTTKPLDVHLMIVDPARYLEVFRDLGVEMLNVHYEACTHLHRTIEQIRKFGMRPAVTLNPQTPVELLEDIVADVDMVLLMSVNPGFGGQRFIENTLDKARRLHQMTERKGLKTIIEVDGGVDKETAPRAVSAGVDALVAGSFVFGSERPQEAIAWLKSL